MTMMWIHSLLRGSHIHVRRYTYGRQCAFCDTRTAGSMLFVIHVRPAVGFLWYTYGRQYAFCDMFIGYSTQSLFHCRRDMTYVVDCVLKCKVLLCSQTIIGGVRAPGFKRTRWRWFQLKHRNSRPWPKVCLGAHTHARTHAHIHSLTDSQKHKCYKI